MCMFCRWLFFHLSFFGAIVSSVLLLRSTVSGYPFCIIKPILNVVSFARVIDRCDLLVKKTGVNSDGPDGLAVHVPLVAPVVLI
jgi:hypothetical protein